MRVLVTGCAGFIGSHLTEALLARGDAVVGIDALTDYYDPRIKRANLRAFARHPRFEFHRRELQRAPLGRLLRGVEVVYHLAGQPGVLSFGPQFKSYVEQNVLATFGLLEAARALARRPRLVMASSSSVYGLARPPFAEDGETRPINPYGITKLAAEQLCLQYHAQRYVETAAFRFFTVYGPRQRPDMAFCRLCLALLRDRPFPVRGTGEALRDFTYVGDVVRVLLAVPRKRPWGAVYNLGGGQTVSLNRAIATLERIADRRARIARTPAAPGEMPVNKADTRRLRARFGLVPATPLAAGLRAEYGWVKAHLGLLP